MMKLIRRDFGNGAIQQVGTYPYITLHTGNHFIEGVAKEEAMMHANVKCVKVDNVADPLNPEQIRHAATIVDKWNKPIAQFWGHWADEEEDEPTYYAVTATVTESTKEGEITRQVPTFLLDAKIQGIVNGRHAAKIAEDVINPTKNPLIRVSTHVVQVQ